MIYKPQTKYYLDKQGCFVIKDYNHAKPFANFFPGIAGKYGIPMWVFYVNRAQCICSFGVKDKDQAILEFFPANKAWQMVPAQGFRTFIKLAKANKTVYYEPFRDCPANLEYRTTNYMSIAPSCLAIEEENPSLGIKIRVEYFNIPNDAYAGLSRTVTLENLSRKDISMQVLDGLPQIIPFGTNNFFLKKLGRTIEAWMNVENLDKNVPFYKLAVDPADRPEVVHIDGGNFYLGFDSKGGKAALIRPIVDPQAVFGASTDFSYPAGFLKNAVFHYPKGQISRSKTPSALLLVNAKLKPKEKKTFHAITGQARNLKTLSALVPKITAPGYINRKLSENCACIDSLTGGILTESSSMKFDLYAKQTYLDNIMRGGYPEVFDTKTVFYLYSRKHGDLERDYNKFQLQPTYLSQGNGNYRDINQNRRSDCWFNPEVRDDNVIFFMNLLQADGFNPLVVKPDSFILNDAARLRISLKETAPQEEIEKIVSYLAEKRFTPGELIFFIEDSGIRLKMPYDKLLGIVFSCSSRIREAEHGEGFWTDHWTYNLDLIDSYLGVYPEKFKELFFEKKCFTFFDNPETVRPRKERYVLYNGKPRQLHCLALNNLKKEMLRKRAENPNVLRMQNGSGGIYYTSLIVKLLCLAVNKLASLDPFGCGIEMEAGKPNWFDSLNGLPALFGSSTCETFELKRLLKAIRKALKEFSGDGVEIAEEIASFIMNLRMVMPEEGLSYWDKSNALKEQYRFESRLGFSGKLVKMFPEDLLCFAEEALKKVESGLRRSFNEKSGTYCSYFINEVTEYELIEHSDTNPEFSASIYAKEQHIKPKKFKQIPAPLFLEGQMHALRLSQDPAQARNIHKAVKKSPLFDKSLRMYKVTSSLLPMPEEIGRCRVFTPGWLENESVWLHMEYKYILELLKNGLNEEFYSEFKNVLIPFLNPESYGRSTLENSSFLASSVFPDKKLRGNGFVARLSGSTAEFLQIWLVMNAGTCPFTLGENGELSLSFNPLLPSWMFKKNGEYSFNFLGCVRVTCLNPKRKNTFGKNGARVKRALLYSGKNPPVQIDSPSIPFPYAEQIRSRKFDRIKLILE
ncbi:MAG: cellobiose phosphorylase [Candidatus Omnitrophota bacterium]